MQANLKYKSSVFTHLFDDPDLLRELYGALQGISLPPDTPIAINTLDTSLFLDRYNDISSIIGGKLIVLLEHQSTICPNLPLRVLIYLAKLYEQRLTDDVVYSRKLITIPRPEFFVLYNGVEPYPDSKVLKLSDAFATLGALGLADNILLDLEVIVYNVNEGRNQEIVQRCQKLAEYSVFIA